MYTANFFSDDSEKMDIDIDLVKFNELLAEYSGSYKHKKMVSKMKEIYRNRELLLDFLERIDVDLKYLIILTYNFDNKIITPQLKKELSECISNERNYPHRS